LRSQGDLVQGNVDLNRLLGLSESAAASWLLIWLYATWGHRLIDRHLDSGYLRRMTLQYVGTVALYSSAVLVSPFSSKWGLGICVGLTLLYLLPPKSPADLRLEHQ
jgi:hypothetical protein